MNKTKKKAGMKLLCVVFLVCILLLSLASCQSKEPVTSEFFTGKMEELGYTIEDITDQYAQHDHITKVVAFQSGGIHVEFFEIKGTDNATSFFNTNKAQVEAYKGGVLSESSVSLGTYQKYVLKTQEKCYIVERVGTTAIYSYCDKSETEALDNIFKAINY